MVVHAAAKTIVCNLPHLCFLHVYREIFSDVLSYSKLLCYTRDGGPYVKSLLALFCMFIVFYSVHQSDVMTILANANSS